MCGGAARIPFVHLGRDHQETLSDVASSCSGVTTGPIRKTTMENPGERWIALILNKPQFDDAFHTGHVKTGRSPIPIRVRALLRSPSTTAECHTVFSQLPRVSTMDSKSQRRRDGALLSLNVAIEAVNLAKEISSITPAKAVFGSVSVVLTMIRVGFLLIRGQPQANERIQDSMINKTDYVDIGLACADVCRALDRGVKGRRVDELSQSVFEAIAQLTK